MRPPMAEKRCRLPQEVDDFLHFLLGFVHAGHILERHGASLPGLASRVLLSSAGMRPDVTR